MSLSRLWQHRMWEYFEPLVCCGLLVIVAGSWVFIEVADEVEDGDVQSLDNRIMLAMRHADDPSQTIGPKWMAEAGRDMTALGGYAVLLLILFSVSGYLWLSGKPTTVGVIWLSVISGYLLTMGLKSSFERPRPILVPHLSYVATTSFPSGHSMMSAIVYITLGALLAQLVPTHRMRLYCLAVPLVITGLVGVSRVYVGVHYPSDVLAGWAAGLVWATICWLVSRHVRRAASGRLGASPRCGENSVC